MKYTRYDIKRNKKNNYFPSIIIIGVLFLAILVATVLAPIFLKNKSSLKTANISNADDTYKYYLVQFASFREKERITSFQSSISNSAGNSYVIQDGSLNRVISGVYNEKQGNSVIKDLNDKKIVNSKITITVHASNLCDKEIVELINANLTLINNLSNNKIEAIKTDDIKQWTSTLKDVDKKSKNYSIREDIINHTQKYNNKLSKENIEENYAYLYNFLKSMK